MLVIKGNKNFYCTKLRVYSHLCKDGFVPLFTTQDAKNPHYTAWVFENTTQLQNSLRRYFGAENVRII